MPESISEAWLYIQGYRQHLIEQVPSLSEALTFVRPRNVEASWSSTCTERPSCESVDIRTVGHLLVRQIHAQEALKQMCRNVGTENCGICGGCVFVIQEGVMVQELHCMDLGLPPKACPMNAVCLDSASMSGIFPFFLERLTFPPSLIAQSLTPSNASHTYRNDARMANSDVYAACRGKRKRLL